jgi:hypothetical protein
LGGSSQHQEKVLGINLGAGTDQKFYDLAIARHWRGDMGIIALLRLAAYLDHRLGGAVGHLNDARLPVELKKDADFAFLAGLADGLKSQY